MSDDDEINLKEYERDARECLERWGPQNMVLEWQMKRMLRLIDHIHTLKVLKQYYLIPAGKRLIIDGKFGRVF